jgi:hypothetical protein
MKGNVLPLDFGRLNIVHISQFVQMFDEFKSIKEGHLENTADLFLRFSCVVLPVEFLADLNPRCGIGEGSGNS